MGVDWGAWTGLDPSGQAAMLSEVMAAVADGRLRLPSPHVFPLSDAGTVLQMALDRQLVGKAVLVP